MPQFPSQGRRLCCLSAALLGCVPLAWAQTSPNKSRAVDVNGAGATFPAQIYQRWVAAYAAETGARVNYQPSGSGTASRRFARAVWTLVPPTIR
ncbi:substrate-binding domain-containing protein [Diaphorobacter aerolatus]|uniref:substrate-binding domain-containing protein n=1 Tax=Diaphorobacter aerolatus TaxID=1288495 RepID=UPI0021F7BABB|nr:substrate-binding domain-containing protein [Diaphorobacter aerolatus]